MWIENVQQDFENAQVSLDSRRITSTHERGFDQRNASLLSTPQIFDGNSHNRTHGSPTRLSPIDQLPNELLVEIFKFKNDASNVNGAQWESSVKALLLTSSRWNQVCSSTAELWSTLRSDSTLSLTRQLISRSKGAPLHIKCENGVALDKERRFLELVVSQIHRWKVFGGELHEESVEQMSGWEVKAPILEVFWVTKIILVDCSGLRPKVPPFVRKSAPLLHTLSIFPFSTPYDSPFLSQLKHFYFDPDNWGTRADHDEWHRLLSIMPDIETIHAEDLRPPYVDGPEETTTFNISLPKLRSLTLENLDTSVLGTLLSSISARPHQKTKTSIQTRLTSEKDASLIFPPSSSSTNLLSEIRSATVLTIAHEVKNSFESESIQCTFYEDEREVDYTLRLMLRSVTQRKAGRQILTSLSSSIGLTQIRVLEIDKLSTVDAQAISDHLIFFSSLETLKIKRFHNPSGFPRGQNLSPICQALYTPVDVEGVMQWPCPQLRSLEFGGFNDLGPISQLVRIRYTCEEQSGVVPVQDQVALISLAQYQPGPKLLPGVTKEKEKLEEVIRGIPHLNMEHRFMSGVEKAIAIWHS